MLGPTPAYGRTLRYEEFPDVLARVRGGLPVVRAVAGPVRIGVEQPLPKLPPQSTREAAIELLENPLFDILLGGLAFGAAGGIGAPVISRVATPIIRRGLTGALAGGLYGGAKTAMYGGKRPHGSIADDIATFALLEMLIPLATEWVTRGGRYVGGKFKKWVDRYAIPTFE
ncbi:MAG: hypothetical protein N3E40_01410 [Dehalococcoidia bacterium]|nr:hypothetical protein [Dehalococcoidia bacterium]